MPEQPKYYAWLGVQSKRTSAVETRRAWLRLAPDRLTGRLSAELVTLQPLHAGSGSLLPPEKLGLTAPDVPLVKAFARRGEQRVIPGSSLKGAFRSLVELFTAACVCKTKEQGTQKDPMRKECNYNSRRREGSLCPVCKMFGAMGYQGQIRFDDAPQQEDGLNALHWIPPQYEPRPDPDNRRYYPHARLDPRQRTWPLEVVPPGQHFALTAQFTNLSEAELGLLFIALGQGEWALCPKIGAGKSSGLGAVRVERLVAEQWLPGEAYRAFDDSTAAWKLIDARSCIEQARSLCRINALDTLRHGLAESAIPEVRDA